MKKQLYLKPETSSVPIQPEGPLCTSVQSIITATPGLIDYELLSSGDIDWDED